MLRGTPARLPWWNYMSERKVRNVAMQGGTSNPVSKNAFHRAYVRKHRKGHFPNRTRSHWNINMNQLGQQRPRRLPWPYDITSMIFNQPQEGADKIGYVVDTKFLKTAVVAANYLVYYPRYNQKVARTGRYPAHDEDMATVEGDLVHIKRCRRISKQKCYYVFSILDPNVEGRERLKLGLPAVPPPLFGYPTTRRIVKLNLTGKEHTKEKLAASIQEHVQDFYRFAGDSSQGQGRLASQDEGEGTTFDDANKLVAENAPATDTITGGDGGSAVLGGGYTAPKLPESDEFTEREGDHRLKKGEDFYPRKEKGLNRPNQENLQRTP